MHPLFVFGIARGGTNLLARVLDAHSQVSVALDPMMPIFKYWRNRAIELVAPTLSRPHAPEEPFQDYYFDADGLTMLNAILSASTDIKLRPGDLAGLREDVRLRAGLEAPEFARSLADLQGETLHDVIASLLDLTASEAVARGKAQLSWVGAKEVWTIDFLPALARAFPEARFLVIHRDPRAVLISLLALAERDPSQKAHATSYLRHWRKQVALTQRFLRDDVLSNRLMAVRFEDLCRNPTGHTAELASFLDIAFEPAMLAPSSEDNWQGNSSFGQISAPIDRASADRWRTQITPAHQALAEFMCAPEMQLIGYECDQINHTLSAEIIDSAIAFGRDPGKWRSDSGDVWQDLAWETLRIAMPVTCRDQNVYMRCFLSGPDTDYAARPMKYSKISSAENT